MATKYKESVTKMKFLKTNFVSEDGRICQLTLTDTHLRWNIEHNELTSRKDIHAGEVSINWIIIAVEEATSSSDDLDRSSLNVHYTVHAPKGDEVYNLGRAELKMEGSKAQCDEWRKAINDRITILCPDRPRNMLVFINPRSGYGKAEELFHNHVAPVLRLAGVNLDVIVTTASNHSTEILDSYDLDKIDSIVTVGGDGTFSVVADALLKRQMRDAGLDIDNPDTDLIKTNINVGVIATGSADAMSKSVSFTRDPLTNALTLLMGTTRHKNVYAGHSGSKLFGYCQLGSGYGFTCQLLAMSEKMRWLGPLRYAVVPLMIFFGRPEIDVEIDMKVEVDGGPSDETHAQGPSGEREKRPSTAWKRFTGSTHDVSYNTATVKYVLNNQPLIRIFNGNHNRLSEVTIVKKCGTFDHLRYFRDLWKPMDLQQEDFPFIEEHKNISIFKVKVLGNYASSEAGLHINWDGEVIDLPAPEFEIRAHFDVFPVFVRSDLKEMYDYYEKDRPNRN